MTWNKKRSKRTIILLSIVLLALLGAGIVGYLQKPSVGIVSHNQQALAANQPQTPSQAVSGKYISFSYPTNFARLTPSQPAGNQLEVFEYIKRPAPFWQLNIQVSQLPTGQLKDDGSYNYRSANKQQFQLDSWNLGGKTVQIYTDTTASYAKVAYLPNGIRLATVSLTGNASSSDDLDSTLRQVASSLEWK